MTLFAAAPARPDRSGTVDSPVCEDVMNLLINVPIA